MTHGPTDWFPFWFRCTGAVLRRPGLWSTAIRQILLAVPARWWARSPYLPLPSRTYLRFRIETAYGSAAAPRAADVVRYLEWCRAAA